MTAARQSHGPTHSDRVVMYALQSVPSKRRHAVEKQISACVECRKELARLRTVVKTFSAWPIASMNPSAAVWEGLADRIGAETGLRPKPTAKSWSEPEWDEVAPGISVKLLATDAVRDRVSMLVRLAPGTDYPPHRHAGVEELHLLDGELRIDDRKLHPGGYNRAEPGTTDRRVRSETGCTCLLITSPKDRLRS